MSLCQYLKDETLEKYGTLSTSHRTLNATNQNNLNDKLDIGLTLDITEMAEWQLLSQSLRIK